MHLFSVLEQPRPWQTTDGHYSSSSKQIGGGGIIRCSLQTNTIDIVGNVLVHNWLGGSRPL